jgi:hypothetical protein
MVKKLLLGSDLDGSRRLLGRAKRRRWRSSRRLCPRLLPSRCLPSSVAHRRALASLRRLSRPLSWSVSIVVTVHGQDATRCRWILRVSSVKSHSAPHDCAGHGQRHRAAGPVATQAVLNSDSSSCRPCRQRPWRRPRGRVERCRGWLARSRKERRSCLAPRRSSKRRDGSWT